MYAISLIRRSLGLFRKRWESSHEDEPISQKDYLGHILNVSILYIPNARLFLESL